MAKAASNLSKFTAFLNEDEAIALLERLRWPNGAACPHCGGADPYRLTPKATTKTRTQRGLWKCSQCRKKFTVKVGTIFEASHIPVSKWLMALHLVSASKKGMSALQLKRMLGLTYRAAWFMAHRLRHAMSANTFLFSGTVEVDETYIGGKRRAGRYPYEPKFSGYTRSKDSNKTPVVALVQRGGGVRAFPMPTVTGANMKAALTEHVSKDAVLMTDEYSVYNVAQTKEHHTIRHKAGIYAQGPIHTNTVEGFFALLKRGIVGTFHHVSKAHLHRYCDEFAFRYTHREAVGVDDEQRTRLLIAATEGKRLTFKQPSSSSAA